MPNAPRDVAPIGDEALAGIEAAMIEGEIIRRGHPIPQIAMTETYNPSYHDVRALIARVRAAEARQQWRPISEAPCDDTWALVHWETGTISVEDLDHDSDPQWWAERGATHWMPLPPPPEAGA